MYSPAVAQVGATVHCDGSQTQASGSHQSQVSGFVAQITLARGGMMQELLVHTLTHYESSLPPSHPTDNLAYLTQITVGRMAAKENRWMFSFLDRTVKYRDLPMPYTSVLYRSHDRCKGRPLALYRALPLLLIPQRSQVSGKIMTQI